MTRSMVPVKLVGLTMRQSIVEVPPLRSSLPTKLPLAGLKSSALVRVEVVRARVRRLGLGG